ncbi:hypothetical protein NPIL_452141 [Nephila pilipes]|uniref:Uncharacterized protein n=1 Tax=Nephila pilipes TaxID=299642 RepID=A0A8X6QVG9_NEPPI|nr:hypothetical protein NPIL_452141 [Nephila pilipes]
MQEINRRLVSYLFSPVREFQAANSTPGFLQLVGYSFDSSQRKMGETDTITNKWEWNGISVCVRWAFGLGYEKSPRWKVVWSGKNEITLESV